MYGTHSYNSIKKNIQEIDIEVKIWVWKIKSEEVHGPLQINVFYKTKNNI